MAEFVQLRKEKWAEPLNSMVQLDLLSHDEFTTVLFNLDKFEYKIQSQTRKLEDILAYIQFECNLLMMIKQRRKHLNQYDLSEEIDRFIYNEIRSQFGSAEINFTHSIDFWNSKLRFVANIVPDEDKESEFNIVFQKVLNYCGRANLDIYRDCVDYFWSFAKKPVLAIHPRKRKRLSHRRDMSKLMTNIRYFTKEAIRNFPENAEASIWLLTTELKYLQVLREEEELYNENKKVAIPFNLEDEVDKSEKLIDVIYRDLVRKHAQTPTVFIKLYDAIRLLPLTEARLLSKKTHAQLITIKNRSPEVYEWLMGKSIDENKLEEFIERVNQALSCVDSKVKMLDMCLEKMNCFVERLELTRDPENLLPRLLQFYTTLVHKDNAVWNVVHSEVLQASRLMIIRKLPSFLDTLPEDSDEKVIADLQSFREDHNADEIVRHFVKQFPSSFVLVKERLLKLLSNKDEEKVKPSVICKYISGVNWKKCKNEDDALKLLKFVYYAFLTLTKLQKESKLDKFLKLSPYSVPGMNEIRLMHLEKMYMEDVEHGRDFYKKFRLLTSDWRFACEVVKIETTAGRNSYQYSEELKLAYEDALRLAGTSTAEPWKVCILSQHELKRKKDASLLMDRALKQFSSDGSTANHEELLLFSKAFASL